LSTELDDGLLLITLDDALWAHCGVIRVLARLATCAPLTQQIPTLVQRDLDLVKASNLFLSRGRTSMFSLERMFVLDELADSVHDFNLVHARSLRRSSQPFYTTP
jgi:hypothetical protein